MLQNTLNYTKVDFQEYVCYNYTCTADYKLAGLTENIMQTLHIDAYYLGEFCALVQDAIQQGYVFDFESNERYPTAFGSNYTVVMVKKETESKPRKSKTE